MSWREYQSGLKTPSKGRSNHIRGSIVLLGVTTVVVCTGGYLWASLGSKSENSDGTATLEEVKKPDATSPPLTSLPDKLDLALLTEGSNEVHIGEGEKERTITLTLDEGLQRYASRSLRKHKVDWGAVAMMDVDTGEVLALASHSEKEPNASNLALRATYPAASVFKIVTAAAAVGEAGYHHDSVVPYNGRLLSMRKSEIGRMTGHAMISVAKAFAHSANLIFAKIGAHGVGANVLTTYADHFGFNQEIPFEFPVQTSRVETHGNESMDEARLAAGFGKVTLSPLHGALIAAAVLKNGTMMRPQIVKTIADPSGKVEYQAIPTVWEEAVSPAIATELRRMMEETITSGTARKGFRGLERDRVLGRLDFGGKTGSLTGDNPKGRTEWFVGYARNHERRVAVGIVSVSERIWKLKPSGFARDLFKFYFSPRPIIEARASSQETQYAR